MNVIDLIVLSLMGIFLILDGLRGFVKSIGFLVSFILGFWFAGHYAYIGVNYLKSWLPSILAYIISFVFILILVFIICHFLTFILKTLLRERIIRFFDHILGIFFGAIKGFFLATILFTFLNLFYPLPPEWKEKSFTYPYLYKLNRFMVKQIPQRMQLTNPKKVKHGKFI